MGRLGFGKFWISFVKGFPAKCNLHLAGKSLTNEIQIPIFPTLMASKIMIKNSNHFKFSARQSYMSILLGNNTRNTLLAIGLERAHFKLKVCGFSGLFGELFILLWNDKSWCECAFLLYFQTEA